MKIILAIAVTALMATTSAYAQVRLGIKAGVNIAEMKAPGKVLDSDNRSGGYLGVSGILMLKSKGVISYGMDFGMLYDRRKMKIESQLPFLDSEGNVLESSVSNEEYTSKQMLFPVNVRMQAFSLNDLLCCYVYAGPQIAFNIGTDRVKEWTLRNSNFSTNMGFGVKLFKHFQVNLNYNIPVGKTGEQDIASFLHTTTHLKEEAINAALDAAGIKNQDTRANTWQIGATYLF